MTGGEVEQMLAEEEAAELSKKPLDEILADDPGRMIEEEVDEADEEFRNSDENLEVDEINRRVEDAGSVIMEVVTPEEGFATADSLGEIEDEHAQSKKAQQEDMNQENPEQEEWNIEFEVVSPIDDSESSDEGEDLTQEGESFSTDDDSEEMTLWIHRQNT